MTTRPIRFWHRGQLAEVHGAAPTRSVLDWLREDARCTGTKEGCNEGDCGACTVVLGRLDAAGALQLTPVNACIQFLPTLDGQALFTVEDLAGGDGALHPVPPPLHPVQQALVDHHASQCGFCTPGFVMSLWHQYQAHAAAGTRPTRQGLADALSGNLCRCTGYRPILDAGEAMLDAPVQPFDAAPVRAALHALAQDPPLHYRAAGGSFQAPRTLDALAATLAERPQAQLLAGSTDVGLWVNKQLRVLPDIVYLGAVDALRQVEARSGVLHIGAGVPLEAAWQALATHWPALQHLWLRFASPLVRGTGTLGGNVANGSPIGDAAPVLMALDATLLLRQGQATRRLPLHQFYRGYMQNALQPGEFLQAVELPLPAPGQVLRAYKISKRFDCDISAVCAGLALQFDGDRIASARLAFGGLAATVQRAARAEAALQGRPWTEAALQAAQAALAQDFQPLTDLRASAGYRLQVAQNLLRRCWLETRLHDPLPAQALNVWPLRLQPAEAPR